MGDDTLKQIRSVVQGYIMNRGRELVEGSEKSVTLTIEECLDFANNVISLSTSDLVTLGRFRPVVPLFPFPTDSFHALSSSFFGLVPWSP